MSRRCTVCDRSDLTEINRRLVSGDSIAGIARDFAGISEDALRRHKESHVPKTLAASPSAQDVAQADTLLGDIRGLREKATGILERAESAGDLKTALLGIREARGCIELLAKVEGQIDNRPQINITLNAEWIELRTLIIKALEPYPDAREAVVHAIHG